MSILALNFMSRAEICRFQNHLFVFHSCQVLLPRQIWYLFSMCDRNMTQTDIIHSHGVNEIFHKCWSVIHPYGKTKSPIHGHGIMRIYTYIYIHIHIYIYIYAYKCEERQNLKTKTLLHICVRLFYHILLNFIFTYLDIKCLYIKNKSNVLGCNFPNEILKDVET